MKKILLSLLLGVFALVANAENVVLTQGSVSCLKGAKFVTAVMDCSNTLYVKSAKKQVALQEYLDRAWRKQGWKEESMEYFCRNFNEVMITTTAMAKCDEAEYELVVEIQEVYPNGNVKVAVHVKNKKTGAEEAVMECKSTDSDSKDEITFRDPMKSVGKLIGKFVKKSLAK